jgi:acetate kinase
MSSPYLVMYSLCSIQLVARLAWLGVHLDEASNHAHGPTIAAASSRVAVYVIPTNEEIVIARATLRLYPQGPW